MSKTTKNDVVETVDTSIETSTPVVDKEPKAYLVKKEDGYHIEDLEGNLSDVCKLVDKDQWIVFPVNASNRKCVKVTVAEKFFAENGDDAKMALLYKATRTMGEGTSRSTKLPNEKLISYLPEAEQEEYKAIIARAIAARDADREANKKKPMTETEKAQAKVTKIMAQLKEMGMSDDDIKALIAGATNEGGND